MPSGHELDTELARMRRTLRRLMAVMTFGLIIGVGAIAAVVGVTLSSADKEAARSFDAGWRKDNGKETRASQARPATVAQAPASPNPSAAPASPGPAPSTATAAPKPPPSRPETTGAASGPAPPTATASSASTAPAATSRPTPRTAGGDHSIKTPPDQASNDSSKKPDQATSQPRKKHSRRYFARTRAKPSDEERAYSSGEYGRPAPEDAARSAQRPERVIVLRRPGFERRPQADGPSDYGGGRESPRGGLFGALFGDHPD